jgi:N2-acetyl-L-2,4-diaminobutanoate deacetylase
MNDGRVWTDIDLDACGKQYGQIFVPVSTDESAYGVVATSVTVISHGQGPSVLLVGGVHGDEYEGPIILSKLVHRLKLEMVNGRLIIVPALNIAALEEGRRNSPLDQLNLNRVFPGRPDGTASESLAYFVTRHLLPRVETLVDLHSGGRSLTYLPLAATHLTGIADKDRRAVAALLAFGAPTALLSRDQDTYGLLDYTAEAMGKLCISTELGGSGVVDPSALLIGDFGVRSLLKHLDVLIDDLPSARPSRLLEMNENSIARSPSRGVYEPIVTLGTAVCHNETLGFIHTFDAVEAEPVSICSKITGLLICRRAQGVCRPGDTLGIVASDISSQARKALLD